MSSGDDFIAVNFHALHGESQAIKLAVAALTTQRAAALALMKFVLDGTDAATENFRELTEALERQAAGVSEAVADLNERWEQLKAYVEALPDDE